LKPLKGCGAISVLIGSVAQWFPIVRRKDEAQYGEYRTKQMVLESYDKLKRRLG
jgi:hypothetical protein